MGSDSDPSGDSAAIFSGHPHISIVTVYRNSCWMRIPSLGLVKGDIIALMAGDITPGKVHELLPEENLRKNNLLQDITPYSIEDIEKIIIKKIDDSSDINNNDKSIKNNIKNIDSDCEEENFYQKNNKTSKDNKINEGDDQEPSWSIREDSASTKTNLASNVKNPILSYASKSNNNFKIEKMLEKGTKIHLRSRFPDKIHHRPHTQHSNSKNMNENEIFDVNAAGGSAVFGDMKNKNRKSMRRIAATSDNHFQGKQGSATRVSKNVRKCFDRTELLCSFLL